MSAVENPAFTTDEGRIQAPPANGKNRESFDIDEENQLFDEDKREKYWTKTRILVLVILILLLIGVSVAFYFVVLEYNSTVSEVDKLRALESSQNIPKETDVTEKYEGKHPDTKIIPLTKKTPISTETAKSTKTAVLSTVLMTSSENVLDSTTSMMQTTKKLQQPTVDKPPAATTGKILTTESTQTYTSSQTTQDLTFTTQSAGGITFTLPQSTQGTTQSDRAKTTTPPQTTQDPTFTTQSIGAKTTTPPQTTQGTTFTTQSARAETPTQPQTTQDPTFTTQSTGAKTESSTASIMTTTLTETTTEPCEGFLCSDQKCIPGDYVCDDENDCSDGEDERNCRQAPRLVGGTDEGLLEVSVRHQWGTVCDEDFDLNDATVACRSMGYSGQSKIIDNTFAVNNSLVNIAMAGLDCSGEEDTLYECYSGQTYSCSHANDVAIACSNDTATTTQHVTMATTTKPLKARLGASSVEGTGRLEVMFNDEWGLVCDNGFDKSTSGEVACRMAGFGPVKDLYYEDDQGDLDIKLDGLNCNGDESSLFDCDHNDWMYRYCIWGNAVALTCQRTPDTADTNVSCDGYRCHDGQCLIDAFTRCDHKVDCLGGEDEVNCTFPDVQVRLVNGTGPHSGVVEVLYNGTWGGVCDDFFDIEDAHVLCRMMNYTDESKVQVLSPSDIGVSLPEDMHMWLDDLECRGDEVSISHCPHKGWSENRQRTPDCNPVTEAVIILCGEGTTAELSYSSIQTPDTTMPSAYSSSNPAEPSKLPHEVSQTTTVAQRSTTVPDCSSFGKAFYCIPEENKEPVCLPGSKECDGHIDCPLGEDEGMC